MTDKFLELFKASYTVTKDDQETVYEVELNIDTVVAEIHLPNDMIDMAIEAPTQAIGQLIIERAMIDLTEGVTEALHKVNPDMFPSFANYEVP